MNLVTAALRRPISVVVVILSILMGGRLAVDSMKTDILPSLGVPVIFVAQPYGGMDPAQMEGYLTNYYEYHFLYVTGIEHVESRNIQGVALIKLYFHPGTEMSQALAETIAQVNRARAFMPPGTVPPFVVRFDAGSVAVGNLVFSSESRTLSEMQDLALNRVRPLFSTLPGVSAPPPFGGQQRTLVISLDPERLRAHQMSPDEVVKAVASANVVSPSGVLRIGDRMPMVPVNSIVEKPQELESVPIRAGLNPVFLRDIGRARDAADVPTGFALVNGRRTVYIPVTKRADASTLDVVETVRGNLARFQAQVPEDIRISYEFDQSGYVTRAIGGLTFESILGAFLTGVMVLLFLRDLRSALVVVLNIPLALLASVVSLWATGQTLNVMSLGGLALAVGILVDESTVTVENIHRHLAMGKRLATAVYDATVETTGPRLLAMLCVVAVFVPSFFMAGVAKALFVPLSLAVGFAMAASYLLSSTFVPVLCVWILKRSGDAAHGGDWFDRPAERYRAAISTLLSFRWVLLPIYVLGAVGVLWGLLPRLGTEIFPQVDTGQFKLRLRAPTGTRIEKTEELLVKALDQIGEEVGKENIHGSLAFLGVQASSYPVNTIHLWTSGPEEAVLLVGLKESARHADLAIEPLKERLRRRLGEALPELAISFEPADLVGQVMSFGSATPIEVAVTGPNLQDDRDHAEKIRAELSRIPTLRDLHYGQSMDYPSVDIKIDRERAGLSGVTTEDVTRSLVAATTSSRFTQPVYWADPKTGISYQVQVQVPPEKMDSLEQVRNLYVSRPGSPARVLLRNVASVQPGVVQGEYDRYNMQRMLSLTANTAGEDLGRTGRRVRAAIAAAGKPPQRVTVTVRGQLAPMEVLLASLRVGLGAAVLVIFLLLAANFQSIRLSLVVVSTVPGCLAGVVLMLLATGTTLNVQTYMGGIMAIGVAIANSILLVTFAERARQEAEAGRNAAQAAIIGAATRLRPIVMTSAAMVAGMLPMAMGWGEGGEQTAGLGRSVIGGLLGGTVTTLFILPLVFSAVQGPAPIGTASLDPGDPSSAHHAATG